MCSARTTPHPPAFLQFFFWLEHPQGVFGFSCLLWPQHWEPGLCAEVPSFVMCRLAGQLWWKVGHPAFGSPTP